MANLSYVSKTQAILVLSFLTPIKKEGRINLPSRAREYL
jgi:hypothetical protein